MVAKIIVGNRIFDIPDVNENATYTISASCFKGVRDSTVGELVKFDLSSLIVRGHEIISNKPIPIQFHEKETREDIINGEDRHDYDAQKKYLKETRKMWESRYTLDEMIWFNDFHTAITELEGRVSPNWYRLYEIIKGGLPSDFPSGLRFPYFIENVFARYHDKLLNNTIKTYIRENLEDARRIIDKLEMPNNLVLDPRIGLTPSTYYEFIRKYGLDWVK